MREPLISTVIPAHDAEPHLGACLDSVLAQQGPFRHEIIVIDDGSRDATADMAASRPGIRLLRLKENAGPSAARNAGIAAARGSLVAFLDADDLWPADRLAEGLTILDAHPNIGLVFGDCRVFSDDRVLVPSFFAEAQLDDTFWGDALRVLDQDLKLFRLNYIPTGAVLMRRRHLDAVGGFDPARRLVEDLDLWLRLAHVCTFAHVPALWQLKRVHGANASNRREAMALANLEVLDQHWRPRRHTLRRRGLRMRRYLAHEYCLLGDYRERAGDLPGARRWYFKALRKTPGPRPLYYWLRTLVTASRAASDPSTSP
jgi:glycosyltransferase involved in cell wall biosynthesis